MRVIAGTARGRSLAVPPGQGTRPTSDRVREAIFNSLVSSGLVVDLVVVDLFAGSGAMGIEALSRGARHVTFVESDRAAIAVIRSNLVACGVEDRADVVPMTVERYLGRSAGSSGVDLAVLDPPYAFDGWADLLPLVSADAIIVESNREIDLEPDWDVQRCRAYGSTVVQIATRSLPRTENNPQESMQ